MRGIIGALAMALSATLQPALAQPTRWTDPTGSFSLTFPEGWETFAGQPHAIVSVGPRGSQSGPPLRECDVNLTVHPNPAQLAQPRANELVAGWDEARLVAAMANQQPQVVRYSNDRVGGIQVESSVVDIPISAESGVRTYQRRFLLVRGSEFRMHTISCGAASDADEADRRDMEALLDSLRFNQQGDL